MKKTILALTIPALFATSANAATVYSAEDGTQVDVYGRIQYDIGELNGDDNENIGGDGSARLGVNVKYNLNQDVDLIGKLEWQVTAESDDDANTQDINSRYAWAGFRFMGTTDLTFGKSENPYVQLSDFTDIFELGGAAAYDHGFRIDDQVRVGYSDQGFDLRAAYAFADAHRDEAFGSSIVTAVDPVTGVVTSTSVPNALEQKNQYSLSAGYTFAAGPGDLGLVGAYERVNFDGNPALTVSDMDLDKWGLGVNYAIDGFYFGVTYGQSDQTDTIDADQWEAVGTYTVDAWTLGLGFNFKKLDSAVIGPRVAVEDYILAAKYALNAKTKLYGEYYIDETVNANDRYGVGIQYNF